MFCEARPSWPSAPRKVKRLHLNGKLPPCNGGRSRGPHPAVPDFVKRHPCLIIRILFLTKTNKTLENKLTQKE